MPVDRKPIFAAVKHLRGDKPWDQDSVDTLDRAIDRATGETTARFLPPPEPVKSGFVLGDLSRQRLANVHPKLKECVELAITLSLVDFRVQQGERSKADQAAAFASGNSRTMHSKHLLQPDGKIWAVDLVVLLNGEVTWEFNRYAAIALAMDQAATKLGIAQHIRWGCAWDRVLADFGYDTDDVTEKAEAYLATAQEYSERFRKANPGKKPLNDAPHFEWVP